MNPSYLLDSSVCIPVLRNQTGLGRLPDPALTGIPVVVAAELWTGVKKNLSTHPHQAAKLEAFLSPLCNRRFHLGCGDPLRGDPRRVGKRGHTYRPG